MGFDINVCTIVWVGASIQKDSVVIFYDRPPYSWYDGPAPPVEGHREEEDCAAMAGQERPPKPKPKNYWLDELDYDVNAITVPRRAAARRLSPLPSHGTREIVEFELRKRGRRIKA